MLVSRLTHIAIHLFSYHFQYPSLQCRDTIVSADQPILTSYCWLRTVVRVSIVVGMVNTDAERVATVAGELATFADYWEPIGSHRR